MNKDHKIYIVLIITKLSPYLKIKQKNNDNFYSFNICNYFWSNESFCSIKLINTLFKNDCQSITDCPFHSFRESINFLICWIL